MADARSRRDFLAQAGTGVGSAWIALHWPAILTACRDAQRAAEGWEPTRFLTPEEAAQVEAIAAEILPSEPDGLGAREAGVIHFIDRALEGFLSERAQDFRAGLEDFRRRLRERHPGAASLADLDAAGRVAFLRSVEETPFFGLVWFQTVLGAFADPSHGGNRDKVGWRLLGFEDGHVWQPPFGWYDREANG